MKTLEKLMTNDEFNDFLIKHPKYSRVSVDDECNLFRIKRIVEYSPEYIEALNKAKLSNNAIVRDLLRFL